jgi:hypothetical protein
MAEESPRQRIVKNWVVPIAAAVIGGIAGSFVQATSFDTAQVSDIISVMKDPSLTAEQKIQALQIYEKITDRPWSIIRSMVTYLGIALGSVLGALTVGGFFQRK